MTYVRDLFVFFTIIDSMHVIYTANMLPVQLIKSNGIDFF